MLHLEYPLSAPTLRLTPFQRGDNYPDTGGTVTKKEVKHSPKPSNQQENEVTQ